MTEKEIRNRYKVATNSFAKVFESVQVCAYYCLYIDEDTGLGLEGNDFSKIKIQNFNKFVEKRNDELETFELLDEVKAKIKKNLDIDTMSLAKMIPLRARLKMIGTKKFKYPDVIMRNTNDGIDTFLILAIDVLHDHYRFSRDRILKWWDSVVTMSGYYVDGFEDRHVIEYFKMECDLTLIQ